MVVEEEKKKREKVELKVLCVLSSCQYNIHIHGVRIRTGQRDEDMYEDIDGCLLISILVLCACVGVGWRQIHRHVDVSCTDAV